MPRKATNERIEKRFFVWLISRRSGVYYADGRSNSINLGRQSLGATERDEALRQLERLDLAMAVKHKLADPSLLKADSNDSPTLEEGVASYQAYCQRSAIAGGARPSTSKRYRAVFGKFVPFCREQRLTRWSEVSTAFVHKYIKYLEDNDYAPRTIGLEVTLIKQIMLWLISENQLPASARINIHIKKRVGTETYCWTREQVLAMLERCRADAKLAWFGDLLATLAQTGLRISEVRDLRWCDLDLDRGTLRVTDETLRRRRSSRPARSTKSGRDRILQLDKGVVQIFRGFARHHDGFVFHTPTGARLKPDRVRRQLIRDVLTPLADQFPSSDDEPSFKDGRLHSFRHFFCSMSANANVPVHVVMEWLGHRNAAMVTHYFHLKSDESRRWAAELPSLALEA